ncbi:MAG TPA: HDIG domain-containing protein [Anaeromyxobacteraceae bacterium]|nr:HDIG domain-containing protein [Anaeromyxobacteraceae bacterium]
MSSPPTPQPTREGRLARLVRRDAGAHALSALLVATVSAAAGVLLVPGPAQRLPGPESLGMPAPATFKADRDYEIVDEEATARRRAEAAAAVPPVYQEDAGAAEDAAARIHAAFAAMREDDGRGGRGPLADRTDAERRDAFVSRLQLLVGPEDFAALQAARFSIPAERHLAALAAVGLSGGIVADRTLLPAGAESAFVIRSFRGGAPQGERLVRHREEVRDLDGARAEVVRAAAERLSQERPALRAALARLAAAAVRPTLFHDRAETERRAAEGAAAVKPAVVLVKRGEKIIGDGERVEKRHLVVFEGMRAQRRGEHLASVRFGGGALVGLVSLLLWLWAKRNLPRFRPARRDALLLAALLVGTIALGSLGLAVADALQERFPALPRGALHRLVPFAAGAIVVRLVLSAEVALLFALASGLAAGLLAGQSLGYALHALLTAVAAAGLGGAARERSGFFRAGAGVALVGVLVAVASGLHGGRGASDLLAQGLAAAVGGAVLLPVVTLGVLPLVEGAFGYVTDVKLLELANLNHPALKELIVQAPGTYHHSILMGSMAEAAAQAIGANPLLARVCAYYHDIGKIRNPHFYAENQRGGNPHDAIAAATSALVIKRHVTDGLEMARAWRLPEVVAEVIPQHHGTRLVGYFWAKAQRSPGEDPPRLPPPDESAFRYEGPKPRSREAALVMIADACEASARALDAPGADALRALVERRLNEILEEGQLDECELTLKELSAISAAMARALEAIYHTRPDYPARRPEHRPPVHLVAKGP